MTGLILGELKLLLDLFKCIYNFKSSNSRDVMATDVSMLTS